MITFVYDAMNRMTEKKNGSTTLAVYTYDDTTSGGNKGKGRRTSMADAATQSVYKYSYVYDSWGRLTSEALQMVGDTTYTTSYTYDGASRVKTVTYPTGEVVTQTYNGRGLPHGLSSDAPVTLVSGTAYNQLGAMTQIDLGNGLRNTFGYYGTGGTYDTTGGYYGRLWEIRTLPQVGGTALLDLKHTWDAGGNLATRQDVLASETETFTYDSLDRLTGVSGPYSESFSYNSIGNMLSKNGVSYTYPSAGNLRPHAVTGVGSYTQSYDANGNMTGRANATGTQTLTFDVENRLSQVQGTGGGYSGTSTYVYDGDGTRIKKTEGGNTTVYVNQYYEKDITSGTATSHYYLGGRQIAVKKGSTLEYIHQDHLNSSSLSTDSSGNPISTMKVFSFGETRSSSGTLGTDKKYTGQRLDGTGLYFYNARYYDAGIGRFVSPDTVVPSYMDPQSLNRYSYVLNNPLAYDPTGEKARKRTVTGTFVASATRTVRSSTPTPPEQDQTNIRTGALMQLLGLAAYYAGVFFGKTEEVEVKQTFTYTATVTFDEETGVLTYDATIHSDAPGPSNGYWDYDVTAGGHSMDRNDPTQMATPGSGYTRHYTYSTHVPSEEEWQSMFPWVISPFDPRADALSRAWFLIEVDYRTDRRRASNDETRIIDFDDEP